MENRIKRIIAALLVAVMCFTGSAWNGNMVWAEESSDITTATESGDLIIDGDTSNQFENTGTPEGGAESGNGDVPTVPEGGEEQGNGDVPIIPEGEEGAVSDSVESGDTGETPDSTEGLDDIEEEEIFALSETDVAPFAATPRAITVPEVEHNKRLVKNSDGTYTMTLDVTGLEESNPAVVKKKAEIAIVQDISGSMIYPINGETDVPPYDITKPKDQYGGIRWDKGEVRGLASLTVNGRLSRINQSRDAVSTLLYNLQNQGVLADAALIGFAGKEKSTIRYDMSDHGQHADISSLLARFPQYGTEHIDGIKGAGLFYYYMDHRGTRWDLGSDKVDTVLSRYSRSDTQKYVLFISDGEPIDAELPQGSEVGIKDNTVTDLVNVGKKYPDVEFFFLQIRNIEVRNPEVSLKKVSEEVNEGLGYTGRTHFFTADNDDELTDVFNDIQKEVIEKSTTITNVEITDTLSDYVELADTTWNPKIEYPGSIEGKPTSKLDGKTVTMTIPKLKKGEKCSISFKVRPTQKAYNEYADNIKNNKFTSSENYPDLSGRDTGTYSSSYGFHSNEEATVAYTYGDGGVVRGEFPYKHPVIKVDLIDIPVVKKWEGSADNADSRPNSIDVKLYRKIGNTETLFQTITLKASEKWKGKFTNVAPILPTTTNQSYRIEEVLPDSYKDDYTVKMSPIAVQTGISNTDQLKQGVTITNTSLSDCSLTIKKVLGSGTPNTTRSFDIQIWISEKNTDFDRWLIADREFKYVKYKTVGSTSSGTIKFADGKPAKISLGVGESVKVEGLPRNYYYKVAEDSSVTNDYEVSYQNQSGQFTSSRRTHIATVTNASRNRNTLVIKKVMGEGLANPKKDFTVRIRFYDYYNDPVFGKNFNYIRTKENGDIESGFAYIDGYQKYMEIPIKAGESIEIPNINQDYRYEIEETAESSVGYDVSYDDNKAGTFSGTSEVKTATITNNVQRKGSLQIFKIMGDNFAATSKEFTVQVWISESKEDYDGTLLKRMSVPYEKTMQNGLTQNGSVYFSGREPAEIKLKAREKIKLKELPLGYYWKIAETAESAEGYKVAYRNDGGGYQFTEQSYNYSEQIINSNKREGTLKISKKVPDGFAAPMEDFTVKIWLTAVENDTSTCLTQLKIPYKKTDADGNVTEGEITMPTNPGPIEIQIKAGETILFEKLPLHYYYKIEETAESSKGYSVTYEKGHGQFKVDDQNLSDVIINEKVNPGNLSITKRVDGLFGNRAKEFEITLHLHRGMSYEDYSDTVITGPDGEKITLQSNMAVLHLKHGETATVTGLPKWCQYTIRETDSAVDIDKDYKVSYNVKANTEAEGVANSGESITGTITSSSPITCTVTNTCQDIPETGITGSLAETGLLILAALLLAGMIVLKILQYRFKHK